MKGRSFLMDLVERSTKKQRWFHSHKCMCGNRVAWLCWCSTDRHKLLCRECAGE